MSTQLHFMAPVRTTGFNLTNLQELAPFIQDLFERRVDVRVQECRVSATGVYQSARRPHFGRVLQAEV
jgi:hypothetical protein